MSDLLKMLNPRKFWLKIRKDQYERKEKERLRAEEREKFTHSGFSYDEATERLNHVLSEMGQKPFSDEHSIHWLLFSALSLTHSIETILEIGTLTGDATQVLSRLFPSASITTIDLPESDPILKSSYGRENREKMLEYRNRRIQNTNRQNIEFIQTNSFFLPSVLKHKMFDLIWVDGGHKYPDVSWDLCNAYHMCKPGGVLMCDDIIPNLKGYRDKNVSPDSFEVLEYVKKRTHEPAAYFLKALSARKSADRKRRKYVAMLKKQS